MAAGVPQEKATQTLILYGNMLKEGIAIDEFSYKKGVRELEGAGTSTSISALGILHALYGEIDLALATFQQEDLFADSTVAANYAFMLQHIGKVNLLYECIYDLAEVHRTKGLTTNAYSMAYRFGDTQRLEKYFDMHIKMLSEDENRSGAETHKQELLSEIQCAYRLSDCSEEQFRMVAETVWAIVDKYQLRTGFVEVSNHSSSCYVVDILGKDADYLASVNWELAEQICKLDELDNCALVARFSPPRELHAGISYDSY